jgi:ABC-2 type transport system ATP-binding protein
LKVPGILIQCEATIRFLYASCIQGKIPALFAPIMQAPVPPSADAAPAIRFRNTTRRYGVQRAVEDVTFDVQPGECFGLVGGNGAGKTTLLKCMLDFMPAHAGSIEIFGVPYNETRARAKIAFLPERFVPPYYLTGEDFLRYMLKLHERPYDAKATAAILENLDLDQSALRKPVRAYSKGMNQKLGLAMCFLSDKELLVLDEPTTGLDPKARALFKTQIRCAVARGRSVLLTSHSLADVEEMCQRMALLHQGRLLFLGSPQALREQFDAPTLEAAYLACIAEKRS